DQSQDLGVLFPHELQSDVTIQRLPDGNATDTGDYYRFEVLQSRTYFFFIPRSKGLPPGTDPVITDADGNPIFTTGAAAKLATLDAGVYVVYVGGWTPAQAGTVSYELRIALASSAENPPPLTAGPAPAYRINLARAVATPGGTGGNTGGNGGNGGG